MQTSEFFTMTPVDLLNHLNANFGVQVPEVIASTDDMSNAAQLLAKLTNEYSYLLSLTSLAKIYCREAKRGGNKEEYEDMVDRKEIISNFVDAVKSQYSAISRAITVHIENNNELRMLERS